MTDLATKSGADEKHSDDSVDLIDEFDDAETDAAPDDAATDVAPPEGDSDAAPDDVEDAPEAEVEDEPADVVGDDERADVEDDGPADEVEDAPEDEVEDEPADVVGDDERADVEDDGPADDVEDEPADDVEDEPEDEVEDAPEDEVEDEPADEVADEPDPSEPEDAELTEHADTPVEGDEAESVDEPEPDAARDDPDAATVADPEAATVAMPEAEPDTAAQPEVAPEPESFDTEVLEPAGLPPTPPLPPQAEPAVDQPAPAYAWAPVEPTSRKRRLALWIGIPVGLVAVGVVATSLVLIAPGTSVAGVSVGGLTPGAAADVIAERLARTTIVLTGDGGDAEVTAAELGVSVDARALADEAFAAHPAWNPTEWFAAPTDVPLTLDTATAVEVLREAVPSMYVDPTNAVIGFDAASASYVVTPGIDGAGVDVAAVETALNDAFAGGQARIELPATTAPVAPEGPTFVADATVAILNRMLDSAGFYIGAERTVPVDRATLASWLTVEPAERGTFDVTADASAIQPFVDGLPAAVNVAPVASTTIVNSAGRVLSTPTEGVVGRALTSTDGIATGYAEQLAAGNGVYSLPMSEVPFTTTTLARLLEVDLSEQRLYVKENGNVVDSWLISSGKTNHATTPGRFTINYKTTVQTMNGYDRDAAGNITGTYSTPNVKWPMYFNGGQAFHGVYWHNNYGNRMSHGCVGMPEWRAQWLYNWSPYGTDVWIHE